MVVAAGSSLWPPPLSLPSSKPTPFFIDNKGCVRLWPCYLHQKSILRQKKNYGNLNISPCKNIIFNKSSKKKPKSFKISELYN
jgi:hypothetical protein